MNEDDIVTETNYRIGTVHSVKGETFDATLLILKERAANNAKYANLLALTNPPSEHEELRIAYVGMTRPRRVLMLAVPNEACRVAWQNKLKIQLWMGEMLQVTLKITLEEGDEC